MSSGFSNKNMPRPRSKHLRWMMDEMITAGYHAAALPFGLSSKDILGMAHTVQTRSMTAASKSAGTQTHDDVMAADDIHSGATTCNIIIPASLKKPRNCLYSAKINFDEAFGSTALVVPEGLQQPFSICQVGNTASWLSNAVVTGGLQAGPISLYPAKNYFALNPDVGVTGSFQTYSINTTYASKKQVLSHAEVIITLSNMSANPLYVDLYCVEAKQNIPKTSTAQDLYSPKAAIDIWNNSLSVDSYNLANQSAGLFGNELVSQPGARPTPRGFKDLFKIRSVHHMTLAGAAEETVNYSCPLHMMVDGQKLIQENSLQFANDANIGDLSTVQCRNGLRRHGLEWFGVVRAGLAKQAGPASFVSYGIGQLGYVVQRRVVLHPIKNKDADIQTRTAINVMEQGNVASLQKTNAVDNPVLIQSTFT